MWLFNLFTNGVGLVVNLFGLRDRFAKNDQSFNVTTTEETGLVHIHSTEVVTADQGVSIFVGGHNNDVTFSSCGIVGPVPPELVYAGHCQSISISLPENAFADVVLRGHCNTVKIPRRMQSRVFVSVVAGHCNEVR